MGRSPCCSKEGLNRGAWTAHEDKILTEYITIHGEGRWRNLPKRAGLKRCGKSCRLRWLNYLRPDIKRGNISADEEDLIIRLHKLLGNRWSLIAGRLPGRTDNEIKNYWNTNLGKKVNHGHLITPTQHKAKSSENSSRPQLTSNVTPPVPKLQNNVVRTKASKCSKVLFLNPLPQSSLAEAATVDAALPYHNHSITNQVESSKHGNNGFLSFLNDEDDRQLSTDMLIDFNVGDVCLSDLLNSDLSNVCDFSYSDNNNDELLSPCSDQLLVFSDEILKDWTQTNFADQTSEFLESGYGD